MNTYYTRCLVPGTAGEQGVDRVSVRCREGDDGGDRFRTCHYKCDERMRNSNFGAAEKILGGDPVELPETSAERRARSANKTKK